MNNCRPYLLCICMLFISAVCSATDPTQTLTDAQHLVAYQALIKELRCPKCTNQSLSDSDALISGDLKGIVLTQLKQGKSTEEVKQFLVERYGDFILYNPPVQTNTLLLWYMPLALFVSGICLLVWLYRRNKRYS